jgi:hypothetical protein
MANFGRKNVAVNVVTCADFSSIWLPLKHKRMYKLKIKSGCLSGYLRILRVDSSNKFLSASHFMLLLALCVQIANRSVSFWQVLCESEIDKSMNILSR